MYRRTASKLKPGTIILRLAADILRIIVPQLHVSTALSNSKRKFNSRYIYIYIWCVYIYIYTILDSLSAARQSFLFLYEPRRGESNHFATSLRSMNFSFNERRTRIGRLVFLMRFRRIVRNVYVCLNRAI